MIDRSFKYFENCLSSLNRTSIKFSDINVNTNIFINAINEMFCKHFLFETKFLPIKNFRKPCIKWEIEQLIRSKAEYFQLSKLDIFTVTENNIFKNKVKKTIKKVKY